MADYTEAQIREMIREEIVSWMTTNGAGIESDQEVPIEDDLTSLEGFTLPLVKEESGAASYARIPLEGDEQQGTSGLVDMVADKVQTEGFLEEITQQEFNNIFD